MTVHTDLYQTWLDIQIFSCEGSNGMIAFTNLNISFKFSNIKIFPKTLIVGTRLNRLDEAVLTRTHNLRFEAELREIVYPCTPQLHYKWDIYFMNNFIIIFLLLLFYIMHQSFASPAPPGPGNSGVFNFSIFKARLKARHCRARVLVKPLLKAPAPQGLTITRNNSCELF